MQERFDVNPIKTIVAPWAPEDGKAAIAKRQDRGFPLREAKWSYRNNLMFLWPRCDIRFINEKRKNWHS